MIDSEHPAVSELARRLSGSGTDAERAGRLFAFVRDVISYDLTPVLESREDWLASATLKRGSGFCQQKSVLLAALGRAAGIPTALCFQHLKDHKLLDTRYSKLLPGGIIAFHGLVAFWLDGRWVRVDPSLDLGLCLARGYRLVEFDLVHEALLPPLDLAGRPHFGFLGDMGPFADLPPPISTLLVQVRPLWVALRSISGATM